LIQIVYFERQSETIQKILDFQSSGKVEIAITTRVKADTYGKREDSPIWEKIKNFPAVSIPCLGRYDVSCYDEDVFAGEEDERLNNLILSCVGGNIKNIRDVDHLIAHIKNQRDIFVTNDRDDFIKHRENLKKACGVRIFTPQECLEYLNA